MRERLGLMFVVILAVVGTACLIAGVLLVSDRQDRLCQVLRGEIERQGTTAGKPGSPTYAFYRQLSPRERREAIRETRKETRRLRKVLDFCSVPPQKPGRPKGGVTSTAPATAGRETAQASGQSPGSTSGPSIEQLKQDPIRQPPVPDRQAPGRERPMQPPPAPPAPVTSAPQQSTEPPTTQTPTPHGHERSLLEGTCDLVDRLANVC